MTNAAVPNQVAPAPLEFAQVGAVGQSPRLTGAKILGATISPPPLMGYWFGLLDDKAFKEALTAVKEAVAEMFKERYKSAFDALHLVEAPPAQRLWFYQNRNEQGLTEEMWQEQMGTPEGFQGLGKTPAMWEEQMAKFPHKFEERLADLQRLAEREALGDLVAAPPKQRAS